MTDDTSYRIGFDVGGTFTDFTIYDAARRALHHYKVPSTPHDPSEAIENGLREMRPALGHRHPSASCSSATAPRSRPTW